jgi:hypothetical protein
LVISAILLNQNGKSRGYISRQYRWCRAPTRIFTFRFLVSAKTPASNITFASSQTSRHSSSLLRFTGPLHHTIHQIQLPITWIETNMAESSATGRQSSLSHSVQRALARLARPWTTPRKSPMLLNDMDHGQI